MMSKSCHERLLDQNLHMLKCIQGLCLFSHKPVRFLGFVTTRDGMS